MLTACPECGTQVVAGNDCPLCGTPTPAPSDSSSAPPPNDPAKPVPQAAPPPDAGAARPMDTVARYANQWEVIYDRIRAAVAPKYEVTGILGYGGMAGVYLADEPRLGRKVAIKVMSPGLMVDPQLVERFSQEARTIAQFNHPNIVTIYEVDERDGLHYFTMTYVAGRTLGQVMAGTEGPLPIPVVRAWLYQIGDALAYAHHHGVIHRDVKPGNVLLDQRGNALVTDFGIAKVTDEPGLTRTGMLVGTPAYMSPEQCSSGKVGGASDQYSLGAVAYQMLTGQPPFAGPTLAVLQAHVGQEPRPIRELRPDCPDDLVAAVQRMLEKKPEDRWPTLSAAVAGAGASAPSFDGPVRQQIELLAARAATIRVEPWFDVVREGSTETLAATVLDARGRVLEARKIEWRAGDELIASVTNGRLRAVSPGSTAIDVASDGALTTLTITVESDPVPSIEVEPGEASVATGARIPLDAIVTDWDGDRLDDRAVLWSSSDSTIAKVSPEGVVEGVRPGEVRITASTGGKAATVTLSVSNVPAGAPVSRPSDPDAAATLIAESRPEPKSDTPTPTAATTAPGAKTATPTPTPVPDVIVPGPSKPARKRSLAPFVIAAVAVGAIIGFVVLRPDGGPAAGTVEIGGDLPQDARITAIDGGGRRTQLEGGSASLEPGSYTFEFSAPGYDAYASNVVVTAGGSVTWSPEISETVVPASAGTLELVADLPADATLTITLPDGSTRPLTERTTQLEPGEYAIAFAAPGYEPTSGSVVIEENGSATFSPELRRVAPPAPTEGILRIAGNLPAGATVRLRRPNGQQQQVAPGAQVNLPPGRYSLEFSAPGFEDAAGTVNIVSNETRSWAPDVRAVPAPPPQPRTGTLRIDRSGLPAGATITLRPQNGTARNLNGSSVDLDPGSYTIEVQADGYRPLSRVVRIAAGATEPWAPTLEAIPVQAPDPGPTRDPAADQAAIDTAVRDFVAAFNRRDANTVVPLLPEAQRNAWRALLTNTTAVTNWRASLAAIEPASLTGDQATVRFTVQVTYESGNAGQTAPLRYVGSASRSGNAWTLTSLQIAN